MFTLEEFRRRRERATERLQEHRLDVLVISLKEHLTYLTGLVIHDLGEEAYGLLGADGSLRLVLPSALQASLAEAPGAGAAGLELVESVVLFRPTEDPAATLADQLRTQRPGRTRRVGYEGDWYCLSWERFTRLRTLCPAVEWVEATSLLVEQRIVKSPEEVRVLREAARISDLAMAAAHQAMRVGAREFEVEAAIQEAFARHGSEFASFPPLVGSGWRGGTFHGVPSDRRLAAGDAVFVELAGTLGRYNANMCRTFFIGEPSQEQLRLWELVSRAFWAGYERVRPGAPVGEVDAITREIRGAYLDYVPARAGFGVELSYPPIWIGGLSILVGAPHVFMPGMVFSLEPSVAGYRDQTIILGSIIVVTEEGAEIINRFSHDLLVCG